MKRLLLILGVSLFFLFGCACNETTDTVNETIDTVTSNDQGKFITITGGALYDVVYNKDTKVMYAISRGGYNQGTFTLLVNPDGSPMVYEGE